MRIRIFLAAAVTTAVLVSLFGISQKYGVDMISGWGNSWYTDLGRPFSTIGNPITLAAYLTLMMGAAVALSFKGGSSSWRYRTPWLFALAVIGACWIYTDTRGALLGAMAALPVVLWLAQRRMRTVQPLLIPLAVLVAAGIATVAASTAFGNLTLYGLITTILLAACLTLITVFWFSHRRMGTVRPLLISLAVLVAVGIVTVAASTAFGNLALFDRATNLHDYQDVQVRLYIWQDTIPMILDRPLLGHGPDNFTEPFGSYMSEDLEAVLTNPNTGEVGARVDRVHNDLLQVAVTTGILGLLAYAWVLISYFRNVYRHGGWPLIALSGAVLVYIFEIQTAFPTITSSIAFWGILGVSVAIMRIQDQEGRDPDTPPLERGSIKEALTSGTSRRTTVYELLVVMIIVAVLAAIAIPTFFSQRAEAAEIQQAKVMLNVRKTVSAYEQIKAQSGTHPQEGIYTKTRPVVSPDGGIVFFPSADVTITTDTTPTGGFTVEGESTTLSGTFRYSYNSATDTYAASP